MPFKQQPLNQDEYSMKILKDLGKLETKAGSNKFARYAICECNSCHVAFKVRMNSTKAKEQTICITCSSTKHNLATTPLYAIWNGIRQRCYNPKRKDFNHYGGVGVTMCDEWKDDVIAFSTWCLSNGWTPEYVVDKDVKCRELNINPAIYSPQTISFISTEENAQEANNKAVQQYTVNGEFVCDFSSCTEAALSLGKSKAAKSSVANAARGVNKTAFGFVWKYKM
jgi:hypothetical protein